MLLCTSDASCNKLLKGGRAGTLRPFGLIQVGLHDYTGNAPCVVTVSVTRRGDLDFCLHMLLILHVMTWTVSCRVASRKLTLPSPAVRQHNNQKLTVVLPVVKPGQPHHHHKLAVSILLHGTWDGILVGSPA